MPKFTLQFLLWCAVCLCSFSVSGQVTASFTTDDTAGCAPLVVHFTSTSTGATSYTWNLGNGTPPSYLSTASTAYTTVGTYTVTLTASDGASSSTYTTVIRVYSMPTVSFTASDTGVCPGAPVTFTSTSAPGSWGALTYTWNFGDGDASTLSSPVHSYPTPGYYNVTLFATNVKGCVNSYAHDDYIHVYTPPVISFYATTQFCYPPATVTFSNTTTGAAALAYTWKFGDGGSASPAASPTHTYTTAGNFTVSLKVTDGHGCTDSLAEPAYVNVGSQTATFTSSPTTVCIGFPFTFTNTSTSYVSSNWSFGDGSTSTVASPVHSYTASGTYTVRLITYNGGACYDTITHTVTVLPGSTGSFTISPSEPCPPPAALTLAGTIPPGCTASWFFGDTTTATGTSVTHTFHMSKIYSIDMVITNGSGCRDTVQELDTLYSLFVNASTSSPTSGCIPVSVNFSSYNYSIVADPFIPDSLYVSYPYAVTGYSWNFGDGSAPSSLATPTHSYTAAGVYTALCTITTANGCSASTPVTIYAGVPPHASFTRSPSNVCTGRSTTFVSTSTGAIDNYSWNFGDGVFANGPGYSTVVHLDTVPGVHTVYLIVYDNFCPSTPYSLVDTVDSPKAQIIYAYTCIPNDGITFTDASLGDNTHTWIFGDGATSSLANPIHDYPALTTYTIELATYNTASGCRDTASTTINLTPPSVSFTSDSVNICQNKIDTFLSAVIGSYPVLNYRWYDNSVLVDSVDANLVYPFYVRGLHTISLVIKDSRTCLDTFTRTAYINVAKPIDNYSFTPGFGCAPLAVHFSDLSTDVAGAPIKKYFWSFGDGDTTTITLPNIVHSYTASGAYTVEEITTDTIGCKDTLVTSTLTVNRPTASFSTTTGNVCANSNVYFNNTSTGYTGSLWTFGDGGTSAVPSPNHIYTVAGVYTVKLIVYSSLGCTDTLALTGYITVNPSPTASFYMNDSFAICPPLNVSFFNTSAGATSYYWNLGDSTTSYTSSPGDIYVSPGIYTVELVASNSYGCTDTAVGHASIFGYAGAFSYTPTSGCSPLSVHFSTTLTSASSIIWDFGDGVTSLSATDTTSHNYDAAGAYVPKLILTDTTGCTSFSLGADTIKVDTVIASFATVPNPVCQGTPVAFSNTSTSYYATIASQTWTFAPAVTSTLAAPVHSYSVSGVYPVTLSATDSKGCTGAVTNNVTISAPPPAIAGMFSLCAGSSTTLSDPGGAWSVSGTTVATIGSATGTVTGITHGTATVTFTASTGCSVTANVTVNPSPGAISGVPDICSGSTATFSDTTLGGAWSSSNTAVATVGSATGIVTGVSSGTATISYSFGGSCAVTKTVTVNTSPTAISGPSTVCTGAIVLETDGTTGGTWASSSTTTVTVSASGGLVTGIAPGTTTVTYAVGAGCITAKLITVNLSPVAISGLTDVCQGSTIPLLDGTSGGVWSSAHTGIATVTAAGIVAGSAPGIDTISYTIAGCAAAYPVTVYATPSPVSGPSAVCAGSSIILGDAVSGGTWTSSNTAAATVGSVSGFVAGVAPAIATGIATISYSLGGGCTATKTVSVNPAAPITGITALCAGLTSELTDAVTGGAWSSGTSSVASINSGGLLTTSSSGNTLITYLLPTGCVTTTMVTVDLAPSAITGPLNICIGSVAALIDGGGGTWSTTSTSIATIGSVSGMVTGIATGSASVTYSLGSGCTTNSVITVNPLPSTPFGSVSSVCAGSFLTLTDTTTGGAWSDGGSTAIATVTSTSGTVSGLSAGIASITYALTSTGCAAFKTITINPLPASISGTTSICTGALGSLTDFTSGGTWSSSNTLVATVGTGNGIIGGVLAGVAAISYTLVATGCSAVITVNVTTLPAAIAGTGAVCLGSSASLADANSGGVWSRAGTGIININSGTGAISGLSLGTATVTYSLGATCNAYITVTVNPLPLSITGTTTLCSSSLTTLYDATTGGTWASNDTAIAMVDTDAGIVSGVSAGTTAITYTSALGCTVTTSVNVIAGIPPIEGAADVCYGLFTTLTDFATGGTWNSGNTAIATVSGGRVTGVAPGTTTISYATTGCPASVVFTVNPLPATITGPPYICLRLPYTFADSATGGTWSTPISSVATIGATTGIITGRVTGPVTINYTLPTGCMVSTSVMTDTVPPGITGTSIICVGQTTTLTDTLPGGVWSSGDPVIAPVVTTGTGRTASVSGLSEGLVAISYTQGGCPAIADIGINPLPLPITGISSLCAYSSTINVLDATSGGTWTSVLATVSDSGVVMPYAAGVATLTYTLSTGCFVTATVSVNPLPGPITGSDRLCIGLSTTLTEATPGGVWSSANTAVATVGTGAGLVSSVTPGTTTIAYTFPLTGCKDSVFVTVYPHPSLIDGTTDVCEGSTSTLIDTISGGSWSSSNTALASVDAIAGIVTGILPGTATITYTLAAGCTTASPVTILPLPVLHVVTGGGSYCDGGSGVHIGLNGSAAGVNYLLYNGTTPTDTVAGTGSPLDFGSETAAGTYSVVAKNIATACASNMTGAATIVVMPVTFPALNLSVAPGDTVCTGSSALFLATTVEGGSAPAFQWSVNGVAAGTDTSFYSYTPANNDSVSVRFISSADCAVPDTIIKSVAMTVDTSLTLIVAVMANPGDSILAGQPDTLTATVTNGSLLSYQWVDNGIPIPGATSATFISDTFANGDSLSCIVLSTGICDLTGNGSAIITISNVGVKPLSISSANIVIIPNPNTGAFTIKGSTGSTTDDEASLEVTDLLGQSVYTDNFVAHNGKINHPVSLSQSLANGVYMLSLKIENGSHVFHIDVER